MMHHQFTHPVPEVPVEHFVRESLKAIFQQGEETMATVAQLVSAVADVKAAAAAVEAEVAQLNSSPVPDTVVSDLEAVKTSLAAVVPTVQAASAATTPAAPAATTAPAAS